MEKSEDLTHRVDTALAARMNWDMTARTQLDRTGPDFFILDIIDGLNWTIS